MRSRSRSRNLVLGVGLLSLATVTGSLPALAQPTSTVNSSGYPAACAADTVTKAESDKAHDTFRSGKVQYDDNNHELAITLFKEAYKRDCSKHELLIIISRAYELKAASDVGAAAASDKAEAIRALELFIQREPSNPEVDTYKRRIKQMRDSLTTAPPPTATTATTTQPSPSPQAGEERGHSAYPWILVGVGGAAVAVGIVVIATAPALPAGCDPDAVNPTTGKKGTCSRAPGEVEANYQDRISRAADSQNQPIIGGVVAGLGGALVVGGLLWHFLEPTGPAESTGKTKVTPNVAPGYAGLSLGGSF